ncbi:hypothetical protein BDZ89DRAFT_1148080 [Hymenopellis radicata]|nr:hypothetical protein BDZ89DRAFT_1148080 [Hymenopellis radicata]
MAPAIRDEPPDNIDPAGKDEKATSLRSEPARARLRKVGFLPQPGPPEEEKMTIRDEAVYALKAMINKKEWVGSATAHSKYAPIFAAIAELLDSETAVVRETDALRLNATAILLQDHYRDLCILSKSLEKGLAAQQDHLEFMQCSVETISVAADQLYETVERINEDKETMPTPAPTFAGIVGSSGKAYIARLLLSCHK